ncbi:DMT family transporter [Leptolyngbya sp. O-77]|uniref:DMT family transporter n=1 Tax=Leptolyngbya sp. O-77 TaxID=1080068 RepID=UPI00074D4723|nr:DMT family transporter [Leptolyngbya sp. O-77]BAU41618.1 putative DMT superfamily transporter inner membrane protein [Leptolyngbya sp. O-77]
MPRMPKVTARQWSIFILVLSNVIWGSTFPLIKTSLGTLSPSVLVMARFVVGAIALSPVVAMRLRSVSRADEAAAPPSRLSQGLVLDGIGVSVIMFGAFLTQAIGLETAPASRAAFITSLNVILVPIFARLLGRKISIRVAIAAVLALAGVGLLSWEGGSLGVGDLWVLGCAACWAVYILRVERIVQRYSATALTMVQLVAIALLSLLWAAPHIALQTAALIASAAVVLYLGLFATALTTWTQASAQRHLSATEAAILYTLEPVFASLFAFWWLGERWGLRGWLGGGVILAATLLSQLRPRA